MWDLIVSVPGHCLSFYFGDSLRAAEDREGWKGIVVIFGAPTTSKVKGLR